MLPLDPLLSIRVLGVRVTANLSTLVVMWLMATGSTAGLDPGGNDVWRWISGSLAVLLVVAATVAIHVMTEAGAAAQFGARIRQVHVVGFGGIATLPRNGDTPRREGVVGLVGLVPLMLVGGGIVVGAVAGGRGLPGGGWYSAAAVAGLSITTIQIFPGLGLGGGRILRALVWYLTGSALAGAKVAAAYGFAIGTGLIGLGLGIIGLGGARPYWGLWAILAGWQLSGTARVELFRTRWHVLASSTTLAEIAVPSSRIPAATTIDLAIDPLLTNGADHPMLVVGDDGLPVGLLRLDNLRGVRRGDWRSRKVGSVATPITDLPRIPGTALVTDGLDLLDAAGAALLLVTGPDAEPHSITILTRSALLGRLHDRRREDRRRHR